MEANGNIQLIKASHPGGILCSIIFSFQKPPPFKPKKQIDAIYFLLIFGTLYLLERLDKTKRKTPKKGLRIYLHMVGIDEGSSNSVKFIPSQNQFFFRARYIDDLLVT